VAPDWRQVWTTALGLHGLSLRHGRAWRGHPLASHARWWHLLTWWWHPLTGRGHRRHLLARGHAGRGHPHTRRRAHLLVPIVEWCLRGIRCLHGQNVWRKVIDARWGWRQSLGLLLPLGGCCGLQPLPCRDLGRPARERGAPFVLVLHIPPHMLHTGSHLSQLRRSRCCCLAHPSCFQLCSFDLCTPLDLLPVRLLQSGFLAQRTDALFQGFYVFLAALLRLRCRLLRGASVPPP